MKKSIKNLEVKSIKNIKTVKGGDNARFQANIAISYEDIIDE